MSKVAVVKTQDQSYESIKKAVDQVIEQIGGLEDIIKPAIRSSSSRIWWPAPRTVSPAASLGGKSALQSMRLCRLWAACRLLQNPPLQVLTQS